MPEINRDRRDVPIFEAGIGERPVCPHISVPIFPYISSPYFFKRRNESEG